MDDKKPNEGTLDGQTEFQHNEAVSLRPAEPTPQIVTPTVATPTAAVPAPPSQLSPIEPTPTQPTPSLPDPAAFPVVDTDPYAPQNFADDDDEAQFSSYDDADADVDDDPDQDSQDPGDAQFAPAPPQISWRALEFIPHPKTINWYVVYAFVSMAIITVAYLISHDFITVIVLLIVAGIFGYVAARPPRELSYGLGASGFYINNRFYPYKEYNAFTVINDGPIASIDFLPLKRFALVLSVCFTPEEESDVIDILTQHLPYRNHKRGVIDILMHRIHF